MLCDFCSGVRESVRRHIGGERECAERDSKFHFPLMCVVAVAVVLRVESVDSIPAMLQVAEREREKVCR